MNVHIRKVTIGLVYFCVFLPPAYVVRGKVIFILGNVSLFTIGGGRGYPIPGLGGGVPHLRSGWGRGVPCPRSGWGVPHPRSGQGGTRGYPPGQVWIVGGIQGMPPTIQIWPWGVPMTGWGTPHHDWMGTPPPTMTGWVPPLTMTGWGSSPLDRAA